VYGCGGGYCGTWVIWVGDCGVDAPLEEYAADALALASPDGVTEA
jgi:hypothetical protein